MKKLANNSKRKALHLARRKHRVNTTIKATTERPRLIVTRSNKHIFAQVVDGDGKVVAAVSDSGIKKGTKGEKAFEVGKQVAQAAQKNNVQEVVFDRNGYLYHGRVKQLADGARDGGLVI